MKFHKNPLRKVHLLLTYCQADMKSNTEHGLVEYEFLSYCIAVIKSCESLNLKCHRNTLNFT